MLWDYLDEKGYLKNRRLEIHLATVQSYFPDSFPHPYGYASFRGQKVSFRSNHFHRLPTDIQNRRPPVVQEGVLIWLLLAPAHTAKSQPFVVVWGIVDELPLPFLVPNCWRLRLAKAVDFVLRKFRTKIWRRQLRKHSRA
jgi:hypothetical protein